MYRGPWGAEEIGGRGLGTLQVYEVIGGQGSSNAGRTTTINEAAARLRLIGGTRDNDPTFMDLLLQLVR